MCGVGCFIFTICATFISFETTTLRVIFSIIAFTFFLIASYRIWAKERRRAELLESEIIKNLPNLKAKIIMAACGEYISPQQKITAMTYFVEVANLGTPSVAKDWFLEITGKNKEKIRLLPHRYETTTLGIEGSKGLVLNSNDYIEDKAFRPIKEGELIRGYIFFYVPIDRKEFNVQGTKTIINFFDSADRQYELLDDGFPYMRDMRETPTIPHFTGIEIKRETSKKATKITRNKKK